MPSVNYCGPGNSCTNSILAYATVGDCLNKTCWAHDQCYDDHCVDVAHQCFFTQPQADNCDAPLTTACATCLHHLSFTNPLTGATTSVPSSQNDARGDAVCATAAQQLARSVPPVCQQPACPGSMCKTDHSGMCAPTTTTTTTTSTSTTTTTTTLPLGSCTAPGEICSTGGCLGLPSGGCEAHCSTGSGFVCIGYVASYNYCLTDADCPPSDPAFHNFTICEASGFDPQNPLMCSQSYPGNCAEPCP